MEESRAEESGPGAPAGDASGLRRCDFCGAASPTVRRVALDRGYDRLLRPHRELYACPPCSEAKERERERASVGPR